MGIIKRLTKDRSGKKVNTKVKICVECGSIRTTISKKGIACTDCGAMKKFNNKATPRFKKGDIVRIFEDGKDSELIYEIKKLKKASDGAQLYLLKSEKSKITLLYHESEESHLEKIE